MRSRSWWLAALLVAANTVSAQDPPPAKSTAQEKELLPGTFPAFAVNGPRAKHVHCLFVERDLNPTVAIIAYKAPEKPTEPFAVLLQKLDARAAEAKGAYFGAFAIFLTMDKPLSQDPTGGPQFGEIEKLAAQFKPKEVILAIETRDAAPAATFGVDKDKHEVTVLVYSKHKVERRFAFTKDKPMTDEDVTAILAAADQIIPKKK